MTKVWELLIRYLGVPLVLELKDALIKLSVMLYNKWKKKEEKKEKEKVIDQKVEDFKNAKTKEEIISTASKLP